MMHSTTFISPVPLKLNKRAKNRAYSPTMSKTGEEASQSNASLWKSLTRVSRVLQSARIESTEAESVPTISAKWQQRDVVTSKKRIYTQTYTARNGSYNASEPIESGVPSYSFGTPPKSLRFPTQDDTTYAEIWSHSGLEDVYQLPHGVLYTDEWFGAVSVSLDDEYVAYIADTKPEDRKDGDKEKDWREKVEDKFDIGASDQLGEAYVKRRQPGLYILSLSTGAVERLLGDDVLPGQPVWTENDEKYELVFTLRSANTEDMISRFQETVYNLGVRYCYNRYSQIAIIEFLKDGKETTPRVLSKGEFCAYSPRVWGCHLLYLATFAGKGGTVQPHDSTKSLRYVNLENLSDPVTVIGIPNDPGVQDFPGLYLHDLPKDRWLDDETIVFASVWGSVSRLVTAKICLNGKEDPVILDALNEARKLLDESGLGWLRDASITLLDVKEDVLLISASNPVTPTQLVLLHVAEGEITSATPVTTKSPEVETLASNSRGCTTRDLIAESCHSRLSLSKSARECVGCDVPSERFQVTVLQPGVEGDKNHLIVFPHGGPHVSTLNAYSQGTMALLQRGYAVMYINYRGSLGLGEKSLKSLPGNIGTQDVNEVVQATRWALAHFGFSGASFIGGSHSGFLGAHTSLIPGLFRATVLRNPVVDIASMQGGTDIPDWCFCEAGVMSTPGLVVNAEVLKKMFEVSPVAFVNECNEIGKTLLQLGGGDRRVPVGQGLLWRRVLNGRFGEVCEIRFYPSSGHAVDEVPEGDDAWVAALDFLDATVTSPPTERLHISHRKQ